MYEYNHEHGYDHPRHGHHMGYGHHHRRGSLRIWVFSILQQAPKNGAEIINQIEITSQGNWRPSPGSIYPLLDELQKEASINKREDGRYEITEKGKHEFEWPYHQAFTRQPRSVDSVIQEISSYIAYLEDLKRVDSAKIALNLDKLKGVRDQLTRLIEAP
jgi:DNA-binding PadR family transcriptional regulator